MAERHAAAAGDASAAAGPADSEEIEEHQHLELNNTRKERLCKKCCKNAFLHPQVTVLHPYTWYLALQEVKRLIWRPEDMILHGMPEDMCINCWTIATLSGAVCISQLCLK